ncbi:MAG TPA: protein kinase, partial [Anaerolineae bacterium]|nr:protein kinase [Anaerolineae bacterium]
MPQMCPACSHNNTDQAQTCVLCGFMLRGLLGENTVLSNRYEITSVLGCGAMGAVYLANDRRLKGRRCAIKENRLDASASPEVQAQSRDQFMAEASVLARLDHPNLPKVSDYFIENEREYLVMDYVEGEDLDSRLQRVGAPLAEDQVLNWAQQILDALIYLHTQEPMP